MQILYFLIIGAIAGWLAGKIMQGAGFGLLMNMVIGVGGALLGGLIFRLLGLSVHNVIGSLVTATVGAIVLLLLIPIIRNYLR